MPFLELPGVRLRFTLTGHHIGRPTGPTLLLVHGWGGDSTEWRDIAAALAADHRIVAVDLRGHGRSSAPADGYAPVDFAADLAALLRRLEEPSVVAVGHSMGAQVVVALAAHHPGAVASLIVLDPAYGADAAELARIPAEQDRLRSEGTAWAVRFAAAAHTPSTPRFVRERHERLMAAMDPRVLLAARDAMYLAPGAFGSRPAAEAKLRTLTSPVLTVMTSAARAAWARRALNQPRSRVELFEGSGHYLHEERSEALAALIRTWTAESE